MSKLVLSPEDIGETLRLIDAERRSCQRDFLVNFYVLPEVIQRLDEDQHKDVTELAGYLPDEAREGIREKLEAKLEKEAGAKRRWLEEKRNRKSYLEEKLGEDKEDVKKILEHYDKVFAEGEEEEVFAAVKSFAEYLKLAGSSAEKVHEYVDIFFGNYGPKERWIKREVALLDAVDGNKRVSLSRSKYKFKIIENIRNSFDIECHKKFFVAFAGALPHLVVKGSESSDKHGDYLNEILGIEDQLVIEPGEFTESTIVDNHVDKSFDDIFGEDSGPRDAIGYAKEFAAIALVGLANIKGVEPKEVYRYLGKLVKDRKRPARIDFARLAQAPGINDNRMIDILEDNVIVTTREGKIPIWMQYIPFSIEDKIKFFKEKMSYYDKFEKGGLIQEYCIKNAVTGFIDLMDSPEIIKDILHESAKDYLERYNELEEEHETLGEIAQEFIRMIRDYDDAHRVLHELRENRTLSDAAECSMLKVDGYNIIKKLGEGKGRRVFLARDKYSGDETVIKIYKQKGESRQSGDPLERRSMAEAVRREVRALRRMNNPNVIRYFTCESIGNSYFIEEEYMAGGNMEERLPDLTKAQALKLFFGVIEGVEYVHSTGRLVRDIKLDNTLLSKHMDVAKISDLEHVTSKYGDALGPPVTHGSPRYCAPEVMRGEGATEASDVYSLACCVYYILSGEEGPEKGKVGGMDLLNVFDEEEYEKDMRAKLKRVPETEEIRNYWNENPPPWPFDGHSTRLSAWLRWDPNKRKDIESLKYYVNALIRMLDE